MCVTSISSTYARNACHIRRLCYNKNTNEEIAFYSLSVSQHRAITMAYARDQVNKCRIVLFCFIFFFSVVFGIASSAHLHSTPPSMLCSDFLKCRQIRMSILMMVWFGFTYLSFPLLCFPLARIFSDCELFPCLFSPVIKKEFIKSIFNLHHKHKKEQTNLQPRLSSNSDTCTHINGTQ